MRHTNTGTSQTPTRHKKGLNEYTLHYPQDASFGEPSTLLIYEELWFSFKVTVTHKNKRKQI